MRAHIFDADGVVFDSEPAHARAYIEYAAMFDIELSKDEFMEHYRGEEGREIMRDLFPEATELEITQHVDDQNRLFRSEFVSQVTLVEGFREFLDRIHAAGMRAIVVSNGTRENVEAMLHTTRVQLRALAIEDFKKPKPDPAGYLKALEVLKLPASEAVVYEDTPLGVEAAHRAGIRVVGVASYISKERLRAAGADDTIKNFAELS